MVTVSTLVLSSKIILLLKTPTQKRHRGEYRLGLARSTLGEVWRRELYDKDNVIKEKEIFLDKYSNLGQQNESFWILLKIA